MTEKIKDTFLEDKSEALRTLCLILHNKYNVSISSTAEGIGLRVTYYSDFLTSRRKNLKRKNLHLIETFIFDLYEPLLVVEMKLNRIKIPEDKTLFVI